jgi:adenylosuccinate synthase
MVVGGQWGSEAKGAVAAELCIRRKVDYAVRTGAVNAGHTVYHNGTPYKMQQLPTGWVNPQTNLVLGPGAFINRDILNAEVAMVEKAAAMGPVRLVIDPRAGTHESRHTQMSDAAGRHHRIGATGKGCSEAVMDRIRLRGVDDHFLYGKGSPYTTLDTEYLLNDTEYLLNQAYDDGHQILLEGTQGQGLDLLLGPWPYTTHKPCGPAQWLSESGLSPNLKKEIVMVARTYPIRVAGNSGPMPSETSWDWLGQHTGRVSHEAIAEWRAIGDRLADAWAVDGRLPRWIDTKVANWRFDLWSAQMRKTHAVALSEFHAELWKKMKPETQVELSKLFEFTTVTKKLRRIAAWDTEMMQDMVRQIRPDWVCLTFLNYEFPELWGATEASQISRKALEFVRRREYEMGVEIKWVSTGPEGKHLIDLTV